MVKTYGQQDNREERIRQFSNWINAKHSPHNEKAIIPKDEPVDYEQVMKSVKAGQAGLDAGAHVTLWCPSAEFADTVAGFFSVAELEKITINYEPDVPCHE